MISLIVYGIILGCIIALGAIGLTMVYKIVGIANFAHGDFMTLGAYIALVMVSIVLPWAGIPDNRFGPLSFGWRMVIALPVAMLFVAFIAIFFDKLLYKKLRKKKSNAVVLAMSSLGVAFIIRMIILIIWGSDYVFYRPGLLRPALFLPLGIRIRPDEIFILCTAIFLVVLLHLFLNRTKMGKAMRATSDNPDLALVTGIDTERIISWTWGIGGALTAAGGILYGIDVQLHPGMGWNFLIPIFAATILGSIGNIYGALIGGFVIGIAQEVSTAFLEPTYKLPVAFMIMIIILLVRPEGIFGKE